MKQWKNVGKGLSVNKSHIEETREMRSIEYSILVPVYNVESYLRECIESVLRQKNSSFELILVDDGSTDHSGEICDEYVERYPDFIKVIHKKNEGLISARRVGIREAKGKYVLFLDSDDLLQDSCLEILQQNLLEYDVDMIIYGMNYYYQESNEYQASATLFEDHKIFEGESKKELYERIICDNRLNNLFLKMIKSDILKSDNTDYTKYYDNPFGEDLLQTLYPITSAEKILYIKDKLYIYRIHQKSMIRKFNKDTMWKRTEGSLYGLIENYMKLWGIDTNENNCKRKASVFKNIIDTLVSQLNYSNEKTEIYEFANLYVKKYKRDLKEIGKCKYISRSWRIAIMLFVNRKYFALQVYYKVLGFVLKIRYGISR